LIGDVALQQVEHQLQRIVDDDAPVAEALVADDLEELVEAPLVGDDVLDVGVALGELNEEQEDLVANKIPVVQQDIDELGQPHRYTQNHLLHLFRSVKNTIKYQHFNLTSSCNSQYSNESKLLVIEQIHQQAYGGDANVEVIFVQ